MKGRPSRNGRLASAAALTRLRFVVLEVVRSPRNSWWNSSMVRALVLLEALLEGGCDPERRRSTVRVNAPVDGAPKLVGCARGRVLPIGRLSLPVRCSPPAPDSIAVFRPAGKLLRLSKPLPDRGGQEDTDVHDRQGGTRDAEKRPPYLPLQGVR